MPNRLLLLHAARPSVDPVSEFYLREAGDLAPTPEVMAAARRAAKA